LWTGKSTVELREAMFSGAMGRPDATSQRDSGRGRGVVPVGAAMKKLLSQREVPRGWEGMSRRL